MALMRCSCSVSRTTPRKYTTAPMPLDIERLASSASSSMGAVQMVSCRFILRAGAAASTFCPSHFPPRHSSFVISYSLPALHRGEQGDFLTVLQHVIGALVFHAHGDQRGLLHRRQFGKTHPQLLH